MAFSRKDVSLRGGRFSLAPPARAGVPDEAVSSPARRLLRAGKSIQPSQRHEKQDLSSILEKAIDGHPCKGSVV
jgi:hypothetical protein